jgi:CRISPR-associated protein Cmr1
MSGTNQNEPELRAPSIKGALRFWWRAMNGHLSLEQLKQKEDDIFGGTDNRSKVTIRVVFDEDAAYKIKGEEAIPNNEVGLNYLYYIFKHQQKDRSGFGVGNTFKIIFSCKETEKAAFLNVCAAFWAFVYIGGIGSRARRGAGAIAVQSVEDKNKILSNNLFFTIADYSDIEKFYTTNFSFFKENLNFRLSNTITEYSTFGTLKVSKDSYLTWSACLDDIGKRFSKKRSQKEPNKSFTVYDLPKKAAFGLPIAVREDNIVKLKAHDRRASPLVISIIQKNETSFFWTATHLEGIFMPKNEIFLFETKNKSMSKSKKNTAEKGWTNVDVSLFENFLTSLNEVSKTIKL